MKIKVSETGCIQIKSLTTHTHAHIRTTMYVSANNEWVFYFALTARQHVARF